MTKIDIYSGFLGAGKTTLIKKMITEAYAGQKLVLIENEFGEIGIDGGFLQDAGINITEMNSGCICCSLVGDFGKALEQVIAQYAPERILIEPSGVGKLSDVVAAVEKVTGSQVEVGFTVAVVDAGKVKVYMKNFGEFYNNQVQTAATIILSRTDRINQEKLDAAVALLREQNPDAAIVTTPWDELSGGQLLSAMEGKTSVEAELARMEEEHHHHHHHHADEVFTSWGVETARKFRVEDIEKALHELDEGHCGMILRAKGIVPCVDGDWIHFDYVPEEHNVRKGGADVTGKLCVIGANLNEAAVAALFGV